MDVLYSLFAVDEADDVMDVLENITIEKLSLKYNYGEQDAATSFSIDGRIITGMLNLELSYERQQNQPWSFHAYLGSADRSQKTTVGAILAGICGDSVLLPTCIEGIEVDPASISFTMSLQDGDKVKIHLVFEASLAISGFKVS
jgi:hypothetical protein